MRRLFLLIALLTLGLPFASRAPAQSKAPKTLTVQVNPFPHSVTLHWIASASIVVQYGVYRASTNGGPYTQIASVVSPTLTYKDTSVVALHTYYYVVTSIDSTGMESTYSVQATGAVPGP